VNALGADRRQRSLLRLALAVMLVVAVIGMPIVLAYTSFIYWKFKGKVRLDGAGY